MKTKYVVQTARACMPFSCWGQYGKIGVLEIDADREFVSMISARARGCRRVVRVWDRLHMGTTVRCAFQRALAEAHALADELNKETENE